ncbi:Lrp/AsnC family transcriptional regulator [Halieaceae bacterium IMCC14734]|uniref:Lrp/AsnC family transcriptional regulator n=1 Tax=Candidatus Litorirhabdus singularis TaxID=2518993 RepID=A0ABT3TH78_9GAMM|nr:Lrp/AsnC family transcriptional regulator [Candidatus Litorirhabdus singularis]MCX2980774.1 Lrp/AsnC family transcriptional regulator [Candidatus Litorirhabdus singularis]
MKLDRTDYQILHHIQNNARISNIDLAEIVGLSPSPCLRRVKALEREGVIKRYAGIVDASAVGLPISIFVNVSLVRQERMGLEEFEQRISSYPEVMECYLMTGSSDYLVRVVAPDLQAYERFLADKLTRIPGVANIQSSFALKQVVYNTELPLPKAQSSP